MKKRKNMKDKNSPTEKQILLVEKITNTLNINFPISSKQFTKMQYSNFISAYLEEYKNHRSSLDDDEEYLNWIGAYENDLWCEHY